MKAIYLFLLIILVAEGCKKTSDEAPVAGNITVTGLLQVQGATTYQYGTHTIKNIDQFYALISTGLNLNDYVGKTVTISASKVYGYPLDGGPQLLNVVSIKAQ